jgi:hypothetical protein
MVCEDTLHGMMKNLEFLLDTQSLTGSIYRKIAVVIDFRSRIGGRIERRRALFDERYLCLPRAFRSDSRTSTVGLRLRWRLHAKAKD